MTFPPEIPAKKSSGKRDYVVLEQSTEPGDQGRDCTVWKSIWTAPASSGAAAKRKAISIEGQRVYGPLVAIPARSWNPTTPKVTAQTVLKIEGV